MKILIPTDFSVQADYAYLMAQKLGEKMSIQVNLLHVLPMSAEPFDVNEESIPDDDQVDIKLFQKMRTYAIQKLEMAKVMYGGDIHTHLMAGNLTDAILTYSKKMGAEMIMMGTQSVSGIKDLITGSETQQIIRKSEIPVLSMKCDRSDLQIRHILLLHDADAKSEKPKGMHILKQLASSWAAKVHLLHIGKNEIERDSSLKKLNDFAQSMQLSDYECHFMVDKSVESGAIHFNQMNDMDLVCLGTHGRKNWMPLFVSESNAEKMAKHLYKPIITFHLIDQNS